MSRKKSTFVADNPPSNAEVQAFIDENDYDVNASEFIKYYENGEPPWHDQNGKPVRSWRQKMIAVWVKKPKAKKCWCGKMGVYVRKDDTGQNYWRCEDHKPKHKPLDIPLPQLKSVPQDVKVDVNAARNRNKNALGVK